MTEDKMRTPKECLENLYEKIEEIKQFHSKFLELKNEMFGYTKKNEQGEEKEHKGYIDTIKEKLEGYTETIEDYLASFCLSKELEEKVNEYKSARKKWQAGFIITLMSAIFYSIFIYHSSSGFGGKELIAHYMRNLPLLSFIIWLAVFAGNRRAENLKLEESYKHKKFVVESFIGYKKSIEKLSDDDIYLPKELMKIYWMP